MATAHAVTDDIDVPHPLGRLDEQMALMRRAYDYFIEVSEAEGDLSRAAEWLLDNYYIIQQAFHLVRESMPEEYYHQLPKLENSDLTGYPRVFALAREILIKTQGHLTLDLLISLVQSYQRLQPLTIGEVWALPTMLRWSILELLTVTIAHLIDLKMVPDGKPILLGKVPEDLIKENVIPSYVLSLHMLAVQDWNAFFESVSIVEQILNDDPNNTFARMEFESRDRYRKVVENLAWVTNKDEEMIAETAVALAQEAAELKGVESHEAHVGYYLVDDGRRVLEARIGYCPSWSVRVRRWIFAHRTMMYLGHIGLLTLLISMACAGYTVAMIGTFLQAIIVGLISLLPASAFAVNIVNLVLTRTLLPHILPKLDMSNGVPDEHRTMVVIPAMLTRSEDIVSLVKQIEQHYLTSVDGNIGYALLTDFGDAPQEEMPEDQELVEQASEGIQQLNEKYSGGVSHRPFYLLHRKRLWNPSESCWMGWERKRGKLTEFNRLLLGDKNTSYAVQTGDMAFLSKVRYVITLDADTVMPRNSAHRMIGTLAHQLNRAVLDLETGRVIRGYTVLQPRTEVKPTLANSSLLVRIFSGDVGFDLYTRAVSDVYQDLFGEGSYVGKGIYDVAAFERSLENRVPENSMLSHDLFEGIHGRAGLVTDILLYEDYPTTYLSYVNRIHRWVRGDWQLLPWLLRNVPCANGKTVPNRLTAINLWKIVDNLRRSLQMPVLLIFFILAWIWLPGPPLFWTLMGVTFSAAVLIAGAVIGLAERMSGHRKGVIMPSFRSEVVRWVLSIVFLSYEALQMVDAIVRTIVRLKITRHRFLQWAVTTQPTHLTTATRQLAITWWRMRNTLFMAFALAVLVGLLHPVALPIAAPVLIAWLLSPLGAHWISRLYTTDAIQLSFEQRKQLRCLARRTWLYFERFFGPENHWLPPDHFQEDPKELTAHRTSPTNIGLALLSTLSAYDLGYIGTREIALRLNYTLETMEGLERFRGHFLNWYDTRSLEPLSPRYVSTVDSGNLSACLLALKQGLHEMQQQPAFRWQRMRGLLDSIGVLQECVIEVERAGFKKAITPMKDLIAKIREEVTGVEPDPQRWTPIITKLRDDQWPEIERLLLRFVEAKGSELAPNTLRSLRVWAGRVYWQMQDMEDEVNFLLPWLGSFQRLPFLLSDRRLDPKVRDSLEALESLLQPMCTLLELPALCRRGRARLADLVDLLTACPGHEDKVAEAHSWCEGLANGLDLAEKAADRLILDNRTMAARIEDMFQKTNFDFLFDAQRKVFYIGYNVSEECLDTGHYDLLASEARIASLVAIAKGDVPLSHWLHLGRPLARVDGKLALLSWSGSMFEYLMPNLIVYDYERLLLHQTNKIVVRRQISYAHQKGLPWGISESGYYSFDAALNYQYRAFGVPGLGRKRGLADDMVIAPYASLLAINLAPQEVMSNVEHLVKAGLLGEYGFYESIDYSRSRLPVGKEYAVVKSFMAHHQGMILAALTNYLENESIIRRFHIDPLIQSVELLLQEQVPEQVPVEEVPEESFGLLRDIEPEVNLGPWRPPVETSLPQAHFLSNGEYGVLIGSDGCGYSHWSGIDLTRWRADTTLTNWGTWIYIQDLDTDVLWSTTYQPVAQRTQIDEVFFYAHKAVFRRREQDISSLMEVIVAAKDNVEIRRITLTNHSDKKHRLRIVSFGELVLAGQSVDQRHQAFNKLFIQSEYLDDLNAQLFERRLRSSEDKPIFVVHSLIPPYQWAVQIKSEARSYEGNRLHFIGRGHTNRCPIALKNEGGEPRTDSGVTLDPIMSIAQELELKPHSRMRLAYITAADTTRESVLSLTTRYQSFPTIDRAFDQAASQSEEELHSVSLDTSDLEQMDQLLSALHYPHPGLRAGHETLASLQNGQSGLWPYAISGDDPILLVRIERQEDMPLVRKLLRAHTYWRRRGLLLDLVILNLRDSGYVGELDAQLRRVVSIAGSEHWLNQRGGVFVLRADQMGKEEQVLIESAARVILNAGAGSLEQQLSTLRKRPNRLPQFGPTMPVTAIESTRPVERPDNLLYDNGLGGFTPDGREYVIYLEADTWTPAPWINVISNPEFGFLVSEAGAGYTWSINSGENRLTPWHNDPVSDEPGEAIYLRDEETAEIWSPTPLPTRSDAPYLVRHGAGYSVFEHNSHGLNQRLRMFASPVDPVKILQLRLKNMWDRERRITVTYYVEWVLGVDREQAQQYIVPDFDGEIQALLACNRYSEEFRERVAFVAASKKLHGLTSDRTEFLGRTGDRKHPAGLIRVGLSSTVRAGLDPCGAIQIHLDLPANGVEEVFFLLGQGTNREEAVNLVRTYQDKDYVEATWESVKKHWDEILDTVTVQTPDKAMDLMLNRWLLYQTLSCRLWGRSALYQSSGAFGFRDQLQDVMGLLHTCPDLCREHLLSAARHQFEAGDVLHWWHPRSGRGVRTRISDDLLWLPFVTAEYVMATGDDAILDEKIPFVRGAPLDADEAERYGHWEVTDESYTLYEHCRRALERGTTSGPHSLPLMGSGDWNDGENRVGIKGRGESIWLAWFLAVCLNRFAPFAEKRGDIEHAQTYRQKARELRGAAQTNAWDGSWFLRAFYDDGTPLGSSADTECQIDSISQSWAVLWRDDHEWDDRLVQAMAAVDERLVRREDRLVLLFTPPFDKTPHDPGYIKAYPPGIRENGGQYTHAALWAGWAYADLGDGDQAGELFRLLNPIYHAATHEDVKRYRVEPYVVSADVYSTPPHVGRGGWTWYTGSSSWMYRLGIEAILGLRRRGDVLVVDPCIPHDWIGYKIMYRHKGSTYEIQVCNPEHVNRGVKEVTLDGKKLPGREIPLTDDGQTHEVKVVLG